MLLQKPLQLRRMHFFWCCQASATEGVSGWQRGAVHRDLASSRHKEPYSQRSSMRMRLLSPWYLTESSPFPCCMSGCELYCEGGLGMPGCKILFSSSSIRQAQSSSRQSQVYPFLVRQWEGKCHCHPAPLTEGEEACPGLHSMSATEQNRAESGIHLSAAGSYQPHALLQPDKTFCWMVVQEPSHQCRPGW